MSRARQEDLARAREMFAAGTSAQDVANALGIALRTSFRWRNELGFPPPNAGKAFAEARKKPKPESLPKGSAQPPDDELAAVSDAFVDDWVRGGGDREEALDVLRELRALTMSDEDKVHRLLGGVAILRGLDRQTA